MIALLWWGIGGAFAGAEAEEAEISFQLGLAAFAEGQYDLALSRFLESNRLAPNPAVAFNIAHCYAKTDRYALSFRWYTLAGEALDTDEAQQTVREGLAAVLPRVVVYELASDPPGASVYVDSKDFGAVGTTPLKLALDPSTADRTLVFSKEGYADAVLTGIRGSRGQRIPLRAELVQVVGTVAIQGAEGAAVRVGTPTGPVVCTAPCAADFPPGNRILYVQLEGYRDAVVQIDVVENHRTEVPVELVANTGSVLVQSSEPGSLVEIDGVAAGFTPTVAAAVPVGQRIVRVSRPGFEAVEIPVDVRTDEQVEIPKIAQVPADEVSAPSRRQEQAALAPSSVTVITRPELEAFRYPTLYEALRGVRGFAVSQDSIYGVTTVRGFGQQNDFNNKLLAMSDGAVLNDNFGGAAFLTYDGMIDTDAIEQIEVVRGPGSVLYGAGAVSGVLNIVGAPQTAPQGATVRVGAYGPAFFATGRIHHESPSGFGFRAEISGGASEGRTMTIDPLGPTAPLAVDGFDSFEGYTTQGRAWFGGHTTAQWFYTGRKQYIPTGAYSTNIGYSPDNYWYDQHGVAELRVEPRLGPRSELLTRLFGSWSRFDGSFPIAEDLLVDTYYGANVGLEGRVISEPSDRVRLQLGARGTVSPNLRLKEDFIPAVGASESTLDESAVFYTGSAFAVLDLQPTRAVALSLGVRGDYWSTFGWAPSPRIAAVLQPSKRDVVKVLFGRAFRAPSFFELEYNQPGIVAKSDFDGTVLRPETVWSSEIEYTHRLGAFWTALAAVHASQADALIETVPTDGTGGLITYANVDEPIRSVGADAELRRAFQGGVLASAFYTYLDARYADGELVPNVPRHHAAFKVVFPISAPELRLALRTNLEGTRRINLRSDEATDLALITDLVLTGDVPGLGLDYALGLYNILDAQYAQPASDSFPLRVIPQTGRSILFNVSWNLGRPTER